MIRGRESRWWDWGVRLGLFVLALVPRLLGRVPLSNTDELLWIDRTINFWTALQKGDWASTLQSLHPGAVPPWGFGAVLNVRYGLSQLQSWQAADALPMLDMTRTAALFPVFLTSLTVVVSYGWLARLAGRQIALLAAVLLALEPYYLAHSTLVHLDATVTSLMLLAALAWLVYLLDGGEWRFLAMSGVLTGLAIMTKIQAVYLLPFGVLAAGTAYLARVHGLWGTQSRRELTRLALAFAALIVFMVVTMFVVWPVLWVDAAGVLATVIGRATGHLLDPHALPTFFMGQSVSDPGVLYYALTLAFRLRPLTLVLAALSVPLLALAWGRVSVKHRAALALGVAYPLFFFIQMSLGSQKMERYLLPMFPALVILAAVVLVAVLAWLTRNGIRRMMLALILVSVVLLSVPWLRLAPHYSTYFNPLLGGGEEAMELFTVGGGEGLDLAAAYLNDKPGAEDTWVFSFYPQVFMHYFAGHTQSPRYGTWGGLPVAADYVVITSAQAQRGIYRSTLEFFVPRQPEYTVRINDIEYAWVYRVPRREMPVAPPIQHPLDANFEHRVHLIGYNVEPTQNELSLTLYWQLVVSMHNQLRVRLRLLDSTGGVCTEQSEPPWSGNAAVLSWPDGLAVQDEHTLPMPAGCLPGPYYLAVSLQERDEEGKERMLTLEGEAGTEVVLGPVDTGGP
jgi:4-amino-4-deoxy-L-arabinose transferase-like glycosyltransferase